MFHSFLNKKCTSFFLLVFSCIAMQAQAAEGNVEAVGAAPTNSSSFDFSSLKKNMRASYTGILTGANTAALDGNLDGKGTNMLLKNYFALGYQFSSLIALEVGHELRRYWRPFDEKKNIGNAWDSRDPYLMVRFLNFFERADAGFSASGKIRYYFPISEYTKANVGKAIDSGNGRWNAEIATTQKWLGGDLSLRWKNNFNYRMAKEPMPNIVRERYSFTLAPSLQYQLSNKWQARAEYYSGELRKLSSGKWTKFNDAALGQTIALGANFQPNKSASIYPYVQWGRGNSYRLDRTDIGLIADYYFL